MAVWLWKHQTWSGTLTTVRPTRTSSASRPDAITTTTGLSQSLRLRGKQVRTQCGTIRQLTGSDRDPQLTNLCQSVSTSYNACGVFEWLSHTFITVVTMGTRLWVMSQSRFEWRLTFHGYGVSMVALCEWVSNTQFGRVMIKLHEWQHSSGFHVYGVWLVCTRVSMVARSTIKLVVCEWHQKKKYPG